MTRSVYIIGGAGAGKSTFMHALMEGCVMAYSPLRDLHAKRNAKVVVTLRGHELAGHNGETGVYLGRLREHFPGTDGLDRASSPTGAEWLRTAQLPDFIIAEGATLATRPFLTALHEKTELLLVHLWAEDFVTELRFLARGSDQDPGWVANTVTRSRNLLGHLREAGAQAISVDTGNPVDWNLALATCLTHLKGTA